MDLEIDGMLFLAALIEDRIELLDAMTDPEMGDMFGIAGLGDGVADIARTEIAEAQTALDALIEADETWKPAPIHWGSLLSGTITCDCGWESAHYVYAADAEDEFAEHLREMGVTP